MIKVLHLRSSGAVLGAERVLLELGRELPRLGFEPIVGIPFEGEVPELAERCQRAGIRTQLFSFDSLLSPRGMWAIRRFVKEQRIDIIHTHGYREDIYAYLALDPRRVVATNHLWKRTTAKLRLYAALDALTMRRFARVIAVSQPIIDDMRSVGIASDKITLVGNGIALSDYPTDFARRNAMRSEFGLKDGDFVFGMVSSLSPEKGHTYALQALARIAQRCPAARLVVTGDGETRGALAQEARALGIEQRVNFLGRRQDIASVLQAFDVFLMPSLIEGLPMALLEAMACALPVIATGVGDIPRLVDSSVGALVASESVDVLAEAMATFAEKPAAVLQALGVNGRAKIEREYSSARMAEQYAGIYRELMAAID